MKIHVTELAIKNIKVEPGKKYIRIFDTEQTGFAVLKTSKGAVSYILIYRDADGVQRQEKLGDVDGMTAQAARAAAKSRLKMIQENIGASSPRKRRSQAPLMDDYFYGTYLPTVRAANRTSDVNESNYRNHVQPTFGRRRMDEVSEADILEFFADLKTKEVGGGRWATKSGVKLSESTVKRVMILVRHLYNVAIADKNTVITENPTRTIPLKLDRKIKGRFLTKEQLQSLLEAAKLSENKSLPTIIQVMAGTGLRRENVLAMRWSWLDFNRGTLTVPASADKAKVGFTLYLSAGVLQLLTERRSVVSEGDWVFPNPKTSRPFHSCREAWVMTCKRAGLEGLRMHDLRHTFASLMLDSGADIVDVQKQLGHTQIKTTLVYLHLTEQRKREKANAAERATGLFMQ